MANVHEFEAALEAQHAKTAEAAAVTYRAALEAVGEPEGDADGNPAYTDAQLAAQETARAAYVAELQGAADAYDAKRAAYTPR